MKGKCQHCRLLTCFEVGMRKDHLITREKKLDKQQRIEINRRIQMKIQEEILTENDRICLNHIRTSYQQAIESVEPAHKLHSVEPSINKTYSFNDLLECDQYFPFRFIHFLRSIPEFESLDPADRVSLFKYNYLAISPLRDVLNYDSQRDLFFDDNRSTPISVLDEKYAQICTNLFILFCGYDFHQSYTSHVRTFFQKINQNPLIIQILLLVVFFLKGAAIYHDQIYTLIDSQRVFAAHVKYVELLYRYLLDEYSSNVAPIKMLEIIQYILHLQNDSYIYKENIHQQSYRHEMNPLLKSIFHLHE